MAINTIKELEEEQLNGSNPLLELKQREQECKERSVAKDLLRKSIGEIVNNTMGRRSQGDGTLSPQNYSEC